MHRMLQLGRRLTSTFCILEHCDIEGRLFPTFRRRRCHLPDAIGASPSPATLNVALSAFSALAGNLRRRFQAEEGQTPSAATSTTRCFDCR